MSCTYLPLQLLLLLTAVRTQSQLLSGLNPSARLPRSSLPPLLALPSPFLPRPLGVRPEPVYTHSHPARAAEVFKTSMGSSRSAIRTHIHNHAAYLRLVETCIGMTLDLHECSIYITVSYSVLKLAVCSYIVIFAWKLLYICLNLSIHVLCMLLACAEFSPFFSKRDSACTVTYPWLFSSIPPYVHRSKTACFTPCPYISSLQHETAHCELLELSGSVFLGCTLANMQLSAQSGQSWSALSEPSLVSHAGRLLNHTVKLLSIFVHIIEHREPEPKESKVRTHVYWALRSDVL